MATTAQYLEQLQNDKQVLVDNLVAKFDYKAYSIDHKREYLYERIISVLT